MALTPTPQLYVKLGEMRESNGRITWIVYLAKAEDEAPWDSYQIYSDTIKGRAEYEATRLRYFLGQAPEPEITDFDTDAPPSDGPKYITEPGIRGPLDVAPEVK